MSRLLGQDGGGPLTSARAERTCFRGRGRLAKRFLATAALGLAGSLVGARFAQRKVEPNSGTAERRRTRTGFSSLFVSLLAVLRAAATGNAAAPPEFRFSWDPRRPVR